MKKITKHYPAFLGIIIVLSVCVCVCVVGQEQWKSCIVTPHPLAWPGRWIFAKQNIARNPIVVWGGRTFMVNRVAHS